MIHNFSRKNIEFKANGLKLRGWLYQPESKNKMPAIIMAHGYACVKELYLDKYAEFFAKAGFVVLVYDHRNFGESDSIVDQEIDQQPKLMIGVKPLLFYKPYHLLIQTKLVFGGQVLQVDTF